MYSPYTISNFSNLKLQSKLPTIDYYITILNYTVGSFLSWILIIVYSVYCMEIIGNIFNNNNFILMFINSTLYNHILNWTD